MHIPIGIHFHRDDSISLDVKEFKETEVNKAFAYISVSVSSRINPSGGVEGFGIFFNSLEEVEDFADKLNISIQSLKDAKHNLYEGDKKDEKSNSKEGNEA